MGLKKYEIITVGGVKRVRALRSWRVQDRYVNIGDVGGIVYNEKTLSQDGACWLFRGNFNFPGARIGGDSIVDVGEAAPDVAGSGNLDILGTSAVVGAPVRFSSDKTAADAVVLTADDFEQGTFANYANGQAPGNSNSANFIRTRRPIFMGGVSATLKLDVPGYRVLALTLDRDGFVITGTAETVSGVGVTMTVPAGQYFVLRVTKDPMAAIVPADAAAAKIKFTGTHETKLVIVDSRLELSPANGTGIISMNPGGTCTTMSGAKYPDSVIRGSKVVINSHATTMRRCRMMTELVNVNATIDATTADAQAVGIYHGVNNLAFTGQISSNVLEAARSLIQAYNCDNMVVNPTNFPGLAGMQTAGVPIRFYNCNLNNGRFFHHARIANTYKNIDFDLATADLGKLNASGQIVVSSEVDGMYRLYASGTSSFGVMVESYDSVKSLRLSGGTENSYRTTIYKDAYLNGMFAVAGTNVFGNKVCSHPLAQVLNVAPRAVQGTFNTIVVGETITGVTASANRVCVPLPFRVNGSKGLTINCPTGIEGAIICTDINGVIKGLTTLASGESGVPAAQLVNTNAYLFFAKTGGGAITPADLAGVTVTVYNGCKIVNTGATAVSMKGNIRVEDNATLVNASITGSGYFGGNSVVYYNPTVWASLDFNGAVFMKDDAVFAPSALTGANALVRMEGKAKFTGSVDVASTNLSFIMRDNAVIEGKVNTRSGVVMSGNSKVTATGQIMAASRGVLIMEENASIEANTTVIGAITLSGNYKGNAVKTWTGKRTITDVNAPEYDNNCKTQYDF